ncbi:hypothetical protein GCM10007063_34530 [Lentibacillus kapialis]|uniref:Ribbon-helix-helix protein, CopG family n=1 Tax=Lentibacillus kapialis TaxID=340214 RepID=A0A917Q2X4_9BACI|nr:hypothetical protein [Lentibacillus kapialis]GGK09166.1 hypothetical protein GCM10007063_34530 [Lentibacillus kapialis]
MENSMKRKQYHMTNEDDKIVKDLAACKGWSEAEVVREAIRDYALREQQKRNPLLAMADNAEKYSVDSAGDLSINHDDYLMEINENEKG